MTILKRRLNTAIKRTYYAAKPVLIEQTTPLSTPIQKDKAPCLANSCGVYQFICTCGCTYIGRTTRNLYTHIGEHIPKWLERNNTGIPRSAITKHLSETRHTVNPQTAFKIINNIKT